MLNRSNGQTTFLDSPLVVELGSRVGVGAAGNLMVQLGARVVVVEPVKPVQHGKWRNRPVMMAGKKSIAIDETTAEGRETLNRLLAAADVVLLSSDVDSYHRSIWSGERCRSTILCDMTAFGHSGPLADQPASEALVEAVSGSCDTTGPADQPPTMIGTPLLEMHAAVLGVSAIIAALRVRRLHGFGQRVDVALMDIGVTALINFLPLRLIGKEPTRSGNRHPLYAPWGTYRAKDGWILICSVTDEHWTRVCDAMGRPELVKDGRFATSSARLENFKTVDELVNAWAHRLTVAECEGEMIQRGVACGPIIEVEDVQSEPNVAYRGGVTTLVDPETGNTVFVPATPIRGSNVGGISPASIPRRDQDRQEILSALPTGEGGARITGDDVSNIRPYEGIRIIEVGQYTVAPMASRIMGALGADVIKVEPPTGDAIRNAAPLRSDGASYIFAMSNTDKRGIVLDLRVERDRETLHRLLNMADVLIENLKPGSLGKLGFSSESVRQRHPKLIFCSVNGFGTNSLYPGRPALDTVIQAMSGIMGLTVVQGVPTKAGISVSDNLGGQFALLSMMAGLELRERTGEAVHFDLSMQETSLWATQFEWNGRNTTALVPTLVAASDGYVAAEAAADQIAARLKTAGIAEGRASRQKIVEALAPTIAAAPVLSVGEAVDHPQTVARKLLVMRPTADGESWLVFATPFQLLSTPPDVRCVIPRLGFGGKELLAEFNIDTLAAAS